MKDFWSKTKLEHLQTFDPIWRSHAFDRVEVLSREHGNFSFLGTCYSEYSSGPSLFMLADAAGEIQGPGWYGLAGCRKLDKEPTS